MATPTGGRRTLIADAVISVLAARGSRGLTHRAVDEAAGLPIGSTSYYFRSRAELLTAATPRLAELDAAPLEEDGDPSELIARVFADSLHGRGRERTLARYELVLEGARRPEIRRALAGGTTRLLQHIAALFPSLPPAEAEIRARDVLALIDGLLLANVTAPESERRSPAELADAVARAFDRQLTADEIGLPSHDHVDNPHHAAPTRRLQGDLSPTT